MEQQNRQKKMNPNNTNNLQQNTSTSNNSSKTMNDLMKQQQQQQNTFSPGVISRERSFVRNSNQQNNMNNNNNNSKRRSLAFNLNQAVSQQSRNKPAMDIYRPPKLNNSKLQHSSSSTVVFPSQQSYSNSQHMMNRRQSGLSLGSAMPLVQTTPMAKGGQRPILAATQSHPISPYAPISQQVPLITSPSSGNIIHQAAGINRVKFAVEPEKRRTVNFNNYKNNNQQYLLMQPQQQQQQQTQYSNNNNQGYLANGIDPYNNYLLTNPLQRSKSLSSADVLTRSIAGLGLGLGTDITDIGQFPPEIQLLIDNALDDPNQLNSRCLMELSNHFIMRAVEGRRYALPIARCCLSIIAKEHKETFLEALLNTCRQRYQEREKWLFAIQGMKSPSRVRFTAFMAFLTEMFCQLKRRQLQLRTQCEGVSPPLVLLTLLAKCCEDCVKPPVRSLSEIDCLFYVLTCIGQDLEQQLPQQLQGLLSLIRDAFLNAGDSAPVIRRTLLQLIELQASHWQLPGNTVLYYYPAAK